MGQVALELKAATVNHGERLVTGLAAAWSPDLVDDQFLPSAFDANLAAKASPADVSVLWRHRVDVGPIGVCERITPTRDGLQVVARISEGDFGDRILAAAKALLAHGSKLGMSVGFTALRSRFEPRGSKRLRVIEQARLGEFSLTLPGLQANPAAAVLATKQVAPSPPPRTRAAMLQTLADLDAVQAAWEADDRQVPYAHWQANRRAVEELETFLDDTSPALAAYHARERGLALGRKVLAAIDADMVAWQAEQARQAAQERVARLRARATHLTARPAPRRYTGGQQNPERHRWPPSTRR